MNRNQLMAVMAVAVMLFITVAPVITSDDTDAVGEKGTLVVETSPDFAPFDYTVGKDYAGIDMDIVRAVGKEMGYNVIFRPNNFDSIIVSVQQGKCNIGASGFSINPEREKQVLFSEPYADIHQIVIAKAGLDITSIDDVRDKKISVQTGTTGANFAETISDDIVFQKGYADVVNDILKGKAFCEVVDNTVGIAQVSAHPDELQAYDVLKGESPVETYGFIFAKSNESLCTEFNLAFNQLKEAGEIQKILNYYEAHGYSPETPPYVERDGQIIVETSPDFPPFEYRYGHRYAGIDMDIVQAIGDRINYDIIMRDNNFDSIILSVQEGKCHMGAAGFTKDPERENNVLFSDSYAEINQVVVVKKGVSLTQEDLNGMRIAVQTGTSGAKVAETVTGAKNLDFFKQYTEAVLSVLTGKSDCEIVDSTVAMAQVAANPDKLEILDILDHETLAPTEYYGFIFKKSPEGEACCALVNAALAELKADGTIDEIVKWYSSHDYKEIPSYFHQDEWIDDDSGSSGGFWGDLKDRFYTDFIKNDRYSYIFEGLKNTLIISVIALIIGMLLGTLVAMIRSVHDQTGKLKILNAIGTLYTTIIRGTPVMVQLILIYYVIFASSSLNSVLVASVAFGLNSGAYVAESVRAGINAVPKGQMEAARSLGMNNAMAMITVILPQAVRNILPALGNEGISLLKETSVAGYIGIMDLTRGADIIRGQTYDALLPMLVAALIYLAIVLVLAKLIKIMEKRLNNAY